jgi:hypothetical protein
VATADPGEEVDNDFTDDNENSGNQNQESVNDNSDNTLDDIVNDMLPRIGLSDTTSDAGGSDTSSSDDGGLGGICPIC